MAGGDGVSVGGGDDTYGFEVYDDFGSSGGSAGGSGGGGGSYNGDDDGEDAQELSSKAIALAESGEDVRRAVPCVPP